MCDYIYLTESQKTNSIGCSIFWSGWKRWSTTSSFKSHQYLNFSLYIEQILQVRLKFLKYGKSDLTQTLAWLNSPVKKWLGTCVWLGLIDLSHMSAILSVNRDQANIIYSSIYYLKWPCCNNICRYSFFYRCFGIYVYFLLSVAANQM